MGKAQRIGQSLVLVTALAGVLTAGCVRQQAAGQASVANAPGPMPAAYLGMDVLGGTKLGPDGKRHDAFSPWHLKVAAGQKVVLTVNNWDTMNHSFTSNSLHVDKTFAPSPKGGQPTVSVVTFTAPKKTGTTSSTARSRATSRTASGRWPAWAT